MATQVAQLRHANVTSRTAATTPSLISYRQATQHNPTARSRNCHAPVTRIDPLIVFPQALAPLCHMLWLEAPPAALLGPASWLHMATLTQVTLSNEEQAAGTDDDDDEDFVITVPEGWEENGDEGSELVFPIVPLEEGLALLDEEEEQG